MTERPERTAQGYRRFRCRACGKPFNGRTGSLLNRTQYPSNVIALVVLRRPRYKLALRDLPEIFLIRGIVFSHKVVREWEAKLIPALVEDLQRRRCGKAGRSWYVDETYLKVQGRWCYLYRTIDRSGALVDVMFSEHRAMAAAKAFFRSAKAMTGVITGSGHDGRPRQLHEVAAARRPRTEARNRRLGALWSLTTNGPLQKQRRREPTQGSGPIDCGRERCRDDAASRQARCSKAGPYCPRPRWRGACRLG
ncbi:MAG: DDE-type integrase/transposase/recombinase [Geminicoccaceae bacterium]